MNDANKYLLAFLEAEYLLNSRSYEFMKFYHLMTPLGPISDYQNVQIAEKDQNFSKCVPPEENLFDPDDSHLKVFFPDFLNFICQIDKNTDKRFFVYVPLIQLFKVFNR